MSNGLSGLSDALYSKIIIWLTFLLALIFQIGAWPESIAFLKPTWVILVCSYWVMALPHRVNVGSAFILGLIWDLAVGSPLGVHGMIMSLISYLVAINYQMFRNIALWQQAIIIGILTALEKMIQFFTGFIINHATFESDLLWGAVINTILWPWLFLALRRLRRSWNVR